MKTNLSKLLLVVVLLMAATSGYCQTVEFSATLKADQVEYFQTGWAFGGESIGFPVGFSYSAFGEPGNDIIAVETPIVVLQATGTGVGVDIQSIKLELVITQNFYLTSEVVCEGIIHL